MNHIILVHTAAAIAIAMVIVVKFNDDIDTVAPLPPNRVSPAAATAPEAIKRPVTDAAVPAVAVDRAAIVVAVVIPDDTDPTLPEIAAVPAVVGLVVVVLLLLIMSYLLQRI